jgi:uncharacterized protein YjbI with pentapeptide repeats
MKKTFNGIELEIGPGAYLQGAYLLGANLLEANLRGANLLEANLRGANLRWAYLRGSNLRWANLRWANLRWADLQKADLRWANLREVKLQKADLLGANLQGADLREAKLREANLRGADLTEAKLPEFQVKLPEGNFIAYKKVKNDVVLELEILGERTSSLVGRKCRTSRAKVLRALNSTGTEFRSNHDPNFVYIVGQEVVVSDYDPDIRVECTKGIHFFVTLEEAQSYCG